MRTRQIATYYDLPTASFRAATFHALREATPGVLLCVPLRDDLGQQS